MLKWGILPDKTAAERCMLLVSFSLPLTLLIAWVCYKWIELPAIKLGKSIIGRTRKSKIAVQSLEGT